MQPTGGICPVLPPLVLINTIGLTHALAVTHQVNAKTQATLLLLWQHANTVQGVQHTGSTLCVTGCRAACQLAGIHCPARAMPSIVNF
jgi:hypothetical protein